jgi:drug/metabolite transporter (DMT)-like permease
MNIPHIGEIAALLTACSWAIGVTLFEQVTRKIGTFVTNFYKVIIAFLLLAVYTWITRSTPFPINAPPNAWFWLSLSGIFGFIIGDLFLFQAFKLVGARISMVVYAFAPALTAIGGFFFLDERLSSMSIAGMALTLGGILLVVLHRSGTSTAESYALKLKGAVVAACATICQAVGYLFSKQGMSYCDSITAAQIRLIAAITGFGIMIIMLRKSMIVWYALRGRYVISRLVSGSVFGPFIGVTLSMFALYYAKVGVASTIIATVPIILLVPSIFIFKERVSVYEILGSVAAVSGVALFFI